MSATSDESVKNWHTVLDKKATDGARYLQMLDAGGRVIAAIEVMEMSCSIDQAAICAKMAEILTAAGEHYETGK